jgi:phosphatidate cytidylyltransferase
MSTTHEDPHEYDDAREAPRTEQVRIVGAERAGEAVQRDAEGAGADAQAGAETELGHDGAADEVGPEDAAASGEPLLLHWTDAPTGEIPAVLSRGEEPEGGDPWASLPEPTWREEQRDWEEAEPLVPSLFAGHDAVPRLLAETDEEERQPWSFDLGGAATGRTPGEGHGGSAGELDDLATDELFVTSAPAHPDRGENAASAAADPAGAPGTRAAGAPGTRAPGAPGTRAAGVAAEDADGIAGEPTSALELPGPGGPRGTLEHAVDTEGRGEAAEEVDAGEVDAGEVDVGRARVRTPRERGRGRAAPTWLRAHRRGEHADAAAVAADAAAAAGAVATAAPQAPPIPTRAGADGPGPGTRPAGVSRRGDDALSQRAGRNIPAAIVSGLVIGAAALIAFHFGTVPSMVVVTVVLVAAAIEAYAAFRRTYHPATLLGIVAVAGVIVGSYDKPFAALPVVAVVLFAATVLWHLVGVDRRAEPVRSTAATLFVFFWIGIFGSFAALLLAPSLFPGRTGIAYLLGALIAVVAYDVGALVAGAWVGRHPLSAVSPGKTWEGVLGGAAGAIVFAVVIVRLVHPWTLAEAVVLGIVVAVVSPIGDLCESLVKRQLGLKDMGRILPGHGGLLDRVDGLLFVLPATYYLVRAFGHG